MIPIEQALVEYVRQDAQLATLLGDRVSFTPDRQELTGFPCVTIQEISGVAIGSHSGDSGLVRGRFQFTVVATCYLDVIKVSAYISRLFSFFRGVIGSSPGVRITSQVLNQTVRPRDAGEKLYSKAIDVEVYYERDLNDVAI